MRNFVLTFLTASAIFHSGSVYANNAAPKESQPIGKAQSLTKTEIEKGIERGALCTDANGLVYSRGAEFRQNGKTYRCVKVYGENLTEIKKLAWVELNIKNCALETAD